jgi:outer membrane immunogenic protein
MKKIVIASLAVAALASTSALAADLAVKAPVMKALPPPVTSWTGCYINGGGGYGMSNIDHSFETFPGLLAENAGGTDGGRGWMGTIGGGCDYQIASNWLIGIQGDYNFTHIHGQVEDSVTILQGDANISSTWGIGGRIGYLVTPQLLTYVNGGYTEARMDQVNLASFGLGAPSVFLPSTTFHGWFIGGGTEYAFTWLPIQGLYWRNEYRFAQYNSTDLDRLVVGTGAATAFGDNYHPYVQTITTSLVWRFNWLGPVSARY